MDTETNPEQPRPDVRLAAGHLLEVVPHLMRVIAAEAADDPRHPLTATQLQVMGAVRRGKELPSEVARELRITPATTGGVIDVLERRGMMDRVQHPTDRRCRRLRLTPEGAAQLDAARERALRGLQTMLAGRAPPDVADMERGLSLLRALLDLEAEREHQNTSSRGDPSGA